MFLLSKFDALHDRFAHVWTALVVKMIAIRIQSKFDHDAMIWFVDFVVSSQKWDSSRAATALHRTLDVRHITTESIFFLLVPAPRFFERIECHLHDTLKNVTFALLLHSIDQLVQDP